MDRRKDKTRYAIKEAFVNLMLTNEFNDITVTMLADKAMIGRKTFYLHYGCMEDVFIDIEHDLARDMHNAIDTYFGNTTKDIRNIFLDLNEIIFKNKDMFVRIAKADSYLFFRQMIENLLAETIMDLVNRMNITTSKNLKYYSNYYAAGIVRLYFDYLKGESNLNINELTRIATRATFLSLEDLTDNKAGK